VQRGGDEDVEELVSELIARYGKPVVLAEEKLELMSKEGMEERLKGRDRRIFSQPSPNHAALVMASLAQYSAYIKGG
jgi:hypothetical protein